MSMAVTVAELEAEITTLTAAYAALEAQDAAREGLYQQALVRNAALDAQNQALNLALTSLAETNARHEATIAELRAIEAMLRREEVRLSGQVEALEAENRELMAYGVENQSLSGALAMCRTEIERLQQEVRRLTGAAWASMCEMLQRERDDLKEEVTKYHADLEVVSGLFLVDVPEPGTDIARLMLVNRRLKRELEALRRPCTHPSPEPGCPWCAVYEHLADDVAEAGPEAWENFRQAWDAAVQAVREEEGV